MGLAKLRERQVLLWGGAIVALNSALTLSFFVGRFSNIVAD
mgnify:CR=1 FL=1